MHCRLFWLQSLHILFTIYFEKGKLYILVTTLCQSEGHNLLFLGSYLVNWGSIGSMFPKCYISNPLLVRPGITSILNVWKCGSISWQRSRNARVWVTEAEESTLAKVLQTLTVMHSSWMFCVLFLSKVNCILIHCGITKCLKKIKMNMIRKDIQERGHRCWIWRQCCFEFLFPWMASPPSPTCMWVQMRCNKKQIQWFKHGPLLICLDSSFIYKGSLKIYSDVSL